jgi:hypothetical protein
LAAALASLKAATMAAKWDAPWETQSGRKLG